VQNPLPERDSDALLRVLTLVEGGVRETPYGPFARALRDALAGCGLLARDAPTVAIVESVAQLQRRYRYSLGEFAERIANGAPKPVVCPRCGQVPPVT
jgi:hypothetical protein